MTEPDGIETVGSVPETVVLGAGLLLSDQVIVSVMVVSWVVVLVSSDTELLASEERAEEDEMSVEPEEEDEG